jgi:hypothetical protein
MARRFPHYPKQKLPGSVVGLNLAEVDSLFGKIGLTFLLRTSKLEVEIYFLFLWLRKTVTKTNLENVIHH